MNEPKEDSSVMLWRALNVRGWLIKCIVKGNLLYSIFSHANIRIGLNFILFVYYSLTSDFAVWQRSTFSPGSDQL